MFEYFFYLRQISNALKPIEKQALFYLAAAVSDFYIKPSDMVSDDIYYTVYRVSNAKIVANCMQSVRNCMHMLTLCVSRFITHNSHSKEHRNPIYGMKFVILYSLSHLIILCIS